jgi:hypothetical protein
LALGADMGSVSGRPIILAIFIEKAMKFAQMAQ